jgi:putative FmdB family regulatory protein
MPIYEYRCENGHNFDAIQRMSDDPLTTCEVCGAPVQRVLHAPAVHFKGSGFYNTDYGTKKRARELKSAGEGTSKSNGDGASSSDTKSTSDSGSTSSAPDRSSGGASSGRSSGGDKPAKSSAS